MKERPPRTPSRDQRGRQARTELEAAAHMLMQRIPDDPTDSWLDPSFAASVRSADADLWDTVEAGGPLHE